MANSQQQDENSSSFLNSINIVFILLLLSAAVYLLFFYQSDEIITKQVDNTPLPTQTETLLIEETITPVVQPKPEPEITTIIDNRPAEIVPVQESLDESDAIAVDSLESFSNPDYINSLLIQTDLVRSTVVFLENFSRGNFLPKFSPLAAPSQPFMAEEGENKQLVIAQRNYQRYQAYFLYLNSIDNQKIAAYYFKFKPLIDEAYAEIAKPGSEFEDVLFKVIEQIETTPIINEPIALELESVSYTYQDEYLESLTDAQKFLLRLGPQNITLLKEKMIAIYTEIKKQ